MRRIFAASTILFMLLPLGASAATAQELQAQLQALMQQIQMLQGTVGQIPAAATTPVGGGQCPLISRTLRRGASGDDVSRLQQFLARDPSIYPEAQVTGYYGALTETAVKKFQCRNSIVCDGTPDGTGYGVVGPRTAAILALQCPAGGGASTGGGGSTGIAAGLLRISPSSGNAPLSAVIETHTNVARSCTGGTYELLFGDSAPIVTINIPVGACNELVQTYTHTYQNPGSYVVILRSGAHQTSATISVGGSAKTEDELEASPRSGAAPLNVSFTGKANGPASCSPAAYRIAFGDGTNDATIPVSNCSISTFAVTHGYNGGGSYTARLMHGSSEVDSVLISVGGAPAGSSQGGGSFSVAAGYGGDAFSVLATFQLASSCTAYDIDWGDGKPHSTQATGSCETGQVTKEVSHTYTGNGTYTITLKRGTGSGQTTDTAGVTIAY